MTEILETERDLLGAALIDPRLTEALSLHPGHFSDGRHAAIWAALGDVFQEGLTPDPTTIVERAKGARVEHAMIVTLVGRGIAANAEHYAELITEAARRRDLESALVRAQQLLREGRDADTVSTELAKAIDSPTSEREIEKTVTLDEFLAEPDEPDEWVIPGLITKGDRTIITGGEGLGKTQLIRQMAVCTAAGINPFTFERFEPRVVLYIDCENPKKIMKRKLREIRQFHHERQMPIDDRLWIRRYPQGLDLGQVSDRLQIRSQLRMFRPDLLVIGPAYKLYVGGGQEKDELLARQVTSSIDAWREEFGFAVILEHHSPHGTQTGTRSVRPFGSSLWLRWPEFGFGITPSSKLKRSSSDPKGKRYVDIEHWRGARDERSWPRGLESHGNLPWIDSFPGEL